MSVEFNEDAQGVHVMWGEQTLCGFAFDASHSEADWEHGELRPTKKRIVTCPECARIVLACRRVRVDSQAAN